MNVTGIPRQILRMEGLALFIIGTAIFASTGLSWWFYALLFFTPDLSFAAYLSGPKTGAVIYNALHSTIGPAALAAIAMFSGDALLLAIAAIWAAHVGFDRMLGYGLKYASAFNDTHLGRIGRVQAGA